MFFLIKCAIAIVLVLVALHWREPGQRPTAPTRGDAPISAAHKPRGAKAGDSAADRMAEGGLSVLHAGGEALTRAAQAKCLAAPADCVALARRLQTERAHTP